MMVRPITIPDSLILHANNPDHAHAPITPYVHALHEPRRLRDMRYGVSRHNITAIAGECARVHYLIPDPPSMHHLPVVVVL